MSDDLLGDAFTTARHGTSQVNGPSNVTTTSDQDKTLPLYVTTDKFQEEINSMKQMMAQMLAHFDTATHVRVETQPKDLLSEKNHGGDVSNHDLVNGDLFGCPKSSDQPQGDNRSRSREPLSSTRFDQVLEREVSPAHPIPINQINPSKFDGDQTKARAWLKEYDETMDINGYTDGQKLKRAAAYLTGQGREFYNVYKHRMPNLDWTTFKKSFLTHFCGQDGANQLLIKLNGTRQTSGEHPKTFAMRILNLCYQYDPKMTEIEQLTRLVNGLDDLTTNILIAARERDEWDLEWVLSKLEAFKFYEKRPSYETSRRQTPSYLAQPGKTTSPPPGKTNTKPKDLLNWTCFNCGLKGHIIEECPKPRDDTAISARKAKYREELAKKPATSVARINKSWTSKSKPLPCDNDPKPLLTIKMNGVNVEGRIDSGADMTVLPSDVASKLKLTIMPWDRPSLEAANKTELKVLGMAPVIIDHNGRTQSLIVAVMPRNLLRQPLWGNDFLRLFAVKLDFGIRDTKVESEPSGDVATNPKSISSISYEEAHPIDKVQFGELDVETRKSFETLLWKFSDVFSRNELDIGRSATIKHRIILSDETPVHRPPFRIPVRNRDVVEKLVQEKLATGAFRESKSPYGAPVFLVNKDNGASKRLVADYRGLNAKTIPDRTPMPHPEDVFGLLGGSTIYAKLDITAMFNQIEVDERDVEKTAVTTPFGLFECPLMPFGLINAPATAVRMMKEVLRGLDGKTSFVYFDDIIVFAENSEILVQRCTEVLERIRQHNLKLKPSKCTFGAKTVKFLGHVIDASGIHIDPSRIEKVMDFPEPRNPSDVRSFYGLCSYNRKFIKNFAAISKPLTPLMACKPSEFVWTSEAQLSFEQLRDTLIKVPTLVHFDPRANHELRTDASAYAIGAVLYQKHEEPNLCGIVLYFSKTLTSAQRNYSATERELLAAFSAIMELQHYLLGKRFTLVTDHAALSLLRNHKDPHQRLARWVAQLQAFDFDVIYKRGAEHLDADCMSRFTNYEVPPDGDVASKEGENIIRAIRAASTISSYAESEPDLDGVETALGQPDMITDQHSDPFCRKFIDILNSKTLTIHDKNKQAAGYTLQSDGKLYKILDGELAIVVPERRRPRVLLECHDSPIGAHLGFSRTYALIKSRFFWPKMRKDVKKYVSTCEKCQKRKAKNSRKQGLIQPLPIAEDVFDTVGIDLITKLPNSKGFNTILVCTDNLSKYVVTAPLKNEAADTVISAFFNSFITKYGCPKLVISDRGANLIGATSRDFFEIYGIKRQVTSPRHPQSNGQTERFNRTLAASLTMYIAESQQNWSDYLQAMTFAYNISQHTVTHVAPYELVFNRKPRLPVDNVMERDNFVDPENPGLSLLSTAAMQLMKGYILDSQNNNKRRLDQHRIPCTYKEGDLVVVERPTRVKGGAHKLSFAYVGPYKITRKIGELNFEITSLAPPIKTFVVHPAIIKPFLARDGDVAEQQVPTFVPIADEPVEGANVQDPTYNADEELILSVIPPILSPHPANDSIAPPDLSEHDFE